MTLGQLLDLFRDQAHDYKGAIGSNGSDALVSDALLKLYANEAQDEACRRGELLRDASSAMCTVSFSAGDTTVDLDARIVRIIRARVDGHFASVVDLDRMDETFQNWDQDTARSRPTHLVEGVTTGKLSLWPVPKDDGEIKLVVQRLPLAAMSNLSEDSPEIRRELHPSLVDWMLFRAYSREDTEIYNDAKAQLALRRFEAEFGEKKSGRNEAWMRGSSSIPPQPIA